MGWGRWGGQGDEHSFAKEDDTRERGSGGRVEIGSPLEVSTLMRRLDSSTHIRVSQHLMRISIQSRDDPFSTNECSHLLFLSNFPKLEQK